jgi:hypothetical protein
LSPKDAKRFESCIGDIQPQQSRYVTALFDLLFRVS